VATAESSTSYFMIGELARQSGIGVEALRFYESRQLIEPVGRTETGYRLYDSQVFSRLSFIKKAQSIGFSLDEIAHIVADAKQGAKPCADVRRLASNKLDVLDRRIRELQSHRRDLKKIVGAWAGQGDPDGEVCGLIEGLSEPLSRPSRRRL
jgi:MerR family Zn(II)-responsive transcriptional regulator of zntA